MNSPIKDNEARMITIFSMSVLFTDYKKSQGNTNKEKNKEISLILESLCRNDKLNMAKIKEQQIS